jgi:hypothetical protein
MELAWWCVPIIPAFERLRQEDPEFKGKTPFPQKTKKNSLEVN